MYIIPAEISSEYKIFKNVYLVDLIFIVTSFFFTMSFSNAVNPKMIVPYYIFSAILTVFLIMKSVSNPGIRNCKAIYLMLIRDRKIYHSLDWNVERVD